MSTAAAFDAVSPWGSGTRLAEQTRCSVAPWTAGALHGSGRALEPGG